jgi:hypothetical protein
MTDLKSPRLIIAKGVLFLLLGCLAAGLIIAEQPTLKLVVLLALTIWAFCRSYYFAFYVIEHYIDPEYKFAGLSSALRYLIRRQLSGH